MPGIQNPMPIQITTSFQGTEAVMVFNSQKVAIGRLSDTDKPDLDLSVDSCVSRQHAVLEVKNGVVWLTDLGSRFGTQVNGREIRGQGEWRLFPEDTFLVGETSVRVLVLSANKPAPVPASPRPLVVPPSPGTPPLPSPHKPATPTPLPAAAPAPAPAADLRIVHMMDTDQALNEAGAQDLPSAERRLKMLLDLPRQFGAQTGQTELLQTVMNRVVEVVPAARRGALLLSNPQDNSLLLKAYVSADEPAVSETLARRAIAEKRGFIWRSTQGGDPTMSIREFHILSGMYAPLQWHDEVFGVICVDTPAAADAFEEDDLQFLIAIGLYAGMALAEQRYLADLKKKDKLTDRLLANFSPKVRAMLIEQANAGKLRPGGAKSEVSVLFCDISGFTERAARMDAHDVVDMLNHYFQPIIEKIFSYDGTVDKFVGDAVLAVFGCPQPDREQHLKAAKAALAIQQVVQATTQLRAARGDETCQVRVGLHSGEVFQGFVGSNERLEFTVIGDAVNRAHRYCDAAGDGEILISPEVFQRVYNVVKADKTKIQTKEGELEAYRLNGLRS
jgi:adenylate cyclase